MVRPVETPRFGALHTVNFWPLRKQDPAFYSQIAQEIGKAMGGNGVNPAGDQFVVVNSMDWGTVTIATGANHWVLEPKDRKIMKQIVKILKHHGLTKPEMKQAYTLFTQDKVGAFRLKPFPGAVEVTEGGTKNPLTKTQSYQLDESFTIPAAWQQEIKTAERNHQSCMRDGG